MTNVSDGKESDTTSSLIAYRSRSVPVRSWRLNCRRPERKYSSSSLEDLTMHRPS